MIVKFGHGILFKAKNCWEKLCATRTIELRSKARDITRIVANNEKHKRDLNEQLELLPITRVRSMSIIRKKEGTLIYICFLQYFLDQNDSELEGVIWNQSKQENESNN